MTGNGRRRKGGGAQFYGEALPPVERRALLRALQQHGCDGEVALLRLTIRRLIGKEEADVEGLARAVNALVRALRVQQQIGDTLAEELAAALAEVLEEILPIGGKDGTTEDGQ